jgi:hypothetical protein
MLSESLQCGFVLGMILDVICSASHFIALPVQILCFVNNFSNFGKFFNYLEIGFSIAYLALYVV